MRASSALRASLTAVAALGLLSVGLTAPASGTVHEITGMLCAVANGNASPSIFGPPGITGQNGNSSQGDANLAKPLFATGVATFIPDGGPAGAPLISFDEDHPAAKFTLTGEIVELGDTGLFVTVFEIDSGAWTNCLP